MNDVNTETLDVLVVGAGLAGIGFSHHLKNQHPEKSFAIVEARADIGGTWDMFRYPGIRSDVDMHLYGFEFHPWTKEMGVAPGESIMQYLREVITASDIESHIRLQHRVVRADWDSNDNFWHVEIEYNEGETRARKIIKCRWLQMCAGYYDYQEGHAPDFPNQNEFEGRIIHPQFWPTDEVFSGRHVTVIGSGATAVTVVPALAQLGAQVTMLQRSPTYVFASKQRDLIASAARVLLPKLMAYRFIRIKNLLMERFNYRRIRTNTQKVKDRIKKQALPHLPRGYDYDKHFAPNYEPGTQRICLSPRGDLFQAIRNGQVEVLTDHIEQFTAEGITLKSGKEINTDIIVTATGLKLAIAGNIPISVDGESVDFSNRWIYRGVMFSGVPNMAITVGTLVAPYTLRVEMIAKWVCRVISHMNAVKSNKAHPILPVALENMPKRPFTEAYSSGYVMRAIERFPKQGASEPWVNVQSYDENRAVFDAEFKDDNALFFSASSAQKNKL